MRAMGTADLHIHSTHGDGMATVAEILEFVEHSRPQLDVIAVTEHDTLRASDEARELHARGSFRFDVVHGMEVTTLDGHLLALFIDEPVASFRRIEETLEAIRRQGGLAIVPHPMSWLTRSVTRRVFARVAAAQNDGMYFDGIEEWNASPAGRVTSARARNLNRDSYGLAALGASDAHFLPSIGSACGRRVECLMISSSAIWIALTRLPPLWISRTSVSRASALATSPFSCPPMPSATSQSPRSLSA